MMSQYPTPNDDIATPAVDRSSNNWAERLFGARTLDGAVPDSTLRATTAHAAVPDTPHDVERATATASEATPNGQTVTEAGPPRSRILLVVMWSRKIVATLAVLVILLVAGVGTAALVRGTWAVSPVVSGSMRPGLPVGGVAISERVPIDGLNLRDVIVFRNPSKPSEVVVHRIVRILKDMAGRVLIRTQGDVNSVRDPWTLTIRGQYVYRVRWTLPLLGYVAVAFQNNRGIYLLGAGLVLIVIAITTLVNSRRRVEVEPVPHESPPVHHSA